MRIQESDIRLSSQHERDYRHVVETHGHTSFRNLLQDFSEAGTEDVKSERERVMELLQTLVDAILAALDGKKCPAEAADCRGFPELPELPDPGRPGREVEWNWETTEKISEHERTRVEGSGLIKTKDGKTIDFKLDLDMCRDYSCERKYAESGKIVLHDPLVINFDGKAAELSGERFDFDLDGDGKVEDVPKLGAGSGFLVLDRNGNGRVDDGRELFGTRSGNGFAELAELDQDGNGWLDEADPGFAKLSVWRDKELDSLGEQGIGALWLGSTSSPFALKDKANQLLGEIVASGVYLTEDGRVGNLQQVDLALEPEEPKAKELKTEEPQADEPNTKKPKVEEPKAVSV